MPGKDSGGEVTTTPPDPGTGTAGGDVTPTPPDPGAGPAASCF